MNEVIFLTGNETKFTNAETACEKHGVHLKQASLKIDEVQNIDPEYVITDKVKKAFEALKQPIVVSDDSWEIQGLNGFPGPYMKDMNQWFTPQNFADLTRSLKDRRIFLHSRLAYTDGKEIKLFLRTFEGYLLPEPKGVAGPPSQKIISLNEDNGLSISEVYDQDLLNKDRDVHKTWDHFCKWYLSNTRNS